MKIGMMPSIELLDDAQLELYNRKFSELIMFAHKGATEAHQLAYQFAVSGRPPISLEPVELSPEAWQRDFEDVEVVAARVHG